MQSTRKGTEKLGVERSLTLSLSLARSLSRSLSLSLSPARSRGRSVRCRQGNEVSTAAGVQGENTLFD